MVNRSVQDRGKGVLQGDTLYVFLVTFNPINPACSLTTHLWALTESPGVNSYVWD